VTGVHNDIRAKGKGKRKPVPAGHHL